MKTADIPEVASPKPPPAPATETARPAPTPEPETTAASEAQAEIDTPPSRWKPPTKTWLTRAFIAGLLIAAIAAILYAWQLPPFGGRYEQTDNAYVRGQTTVISPQVSGYVAAVPVRDFQNVKAGDVLVRIEDSIYSAKVAQARANVSTQMANLQNADQAQRSKEAEHARSGRRDRQRAGAADTGAGGLESARAAGAAGLGNTVAGRPGSRIASFR